MVVTETSSPAEQAGAGQSARDSEEGCCGCVERKKQGTVIS